MCAENNNPFRVLVVDDEKDQVDSECAVLREYGFDCVPAYDGNAAIRLAESVRPDVLLLDLGMPQDGYKVAQQVRRLPCPPVIIAVTGHGTDESRLRADAAGISMYLLKPVDMDLLRAILDHLRHRAAAPAR